MAAPPPRRRDPGILSEPIDLDGPRRGGTQHPTVPAHAGLLVKQRGTPIEERSSASSTGTCTCATAAASSTA
ncbi:MAG: hypothetical protein R2701_04090 [Acidimicrobiales bacterium]